MKNASVCLTSIDPVRVFMESDYIDFPYNLGGVSLGLPFGLPNSSGCADFLVMPSGEIVGVTVGVSSEDLIEVKAMLAGSQSERIRIREAGPLLPSRYAAYPQWNWLEVSWRETASARLVEAQTNHVLWFTQTRDAPRLTVMVLEHLDYIEKEAGGWFSFTRRMPEA